MPSRIRWRWAIPSFFVLELLMFAAAFGWVAIYSVAVRPGEDAAHYEAYAQWASPIVSLVAGTPLFLFAGRWFYRKLHADAVRTVLVIVAIYAGIDLLLLASWPETTTYHVAIAILSTSTKAAVAYAGARTTEPRITRDRCLTKMPTSASRTANDAPRGDVLAHGSCTLRA